MHTTLPKRVLAPAAPLDLTRAFSISRAAIALAHHAGGSHIPTYRFGQRSQVGFEQ
jgi:hypothetical protein